MKALFRKLLRFHASRQAALGRTLLALVVLPLLLVLIVSLLHQGLLLATAFALNAGASNNLFSNIAVAFGFDPVYASVLNQMLGDIQIRGISIAGPIGDALHEVSPALFGQAYRVVDGSWITGLVYGGGSILAATLTMMAADLILIVFGLTTFARFWSRRSRLNYLALMPLLMSGLLQVKGATDLFALRLSPAELEVMGLAHVFTKLLPASADSYSQFVNDPRLLFAANYAGGILVLLTYACLSTLWMIRHPWRRLSSPQAVISSVMGFLHLNLKATSKNVRPAFASLIVVLIFSQGVLADAVDYNYVPQSTDNTIEQDQVAVMATASPTPVPEKKTPTPEKAKVVALIGPSKVFIEGHGYVFRYMVNGRPERIRGVGYNVPRSSMSQEARASRYDRDFAQMRAAGINTILGWDQWEFDDLTLEKAQEYGLGVVMPFHLSSKYDYRDPEYVQDLEQRVMKWVIQYKGFPALRMWGLGNEVIHEMGGPNKEETKDFARVLVRLADVIHVLDPGHPVVYRDAEDVNFPPVNDVLKNSEIRRPWFVYGINIFTYRVDQVFREWPEKGLDMPLLVSEFAPSGLGPPDRPKGYLRMWRSIRKQSDFVLGGFAYVWCTRGPEAVDRTMGLVDEDGEASDGSLAVLSRAFARDGAGSEATDETGKASRLGRP